MFGVQTLTMHILTLYNVYTKWTKLTGKGDPWYEPLFMVKDHEWCCEFVDKNTPIILLMRGAN